PPATHELPSFPTRRSSDLQGRPQPARARAAPAQDGGRRDREGRRRGAQALQGALRGHREAGNLVGGTHDDDEEDGRAGPSAGAQDRKSTRLNSSHLVTSYA